MTGSVIDGEDVVQEALVKAVQAYGHAGPIEDIEAWLDGKPINVLNPDALKK